MDFSFLEGFHQQWQDILVIGRTVERDNKKYHLLGMTLADEAKLYVIEPCENDKRKSQERSPDTAQKSKGTGSKRVQLSALQRFLFR